MTAEHTQSNQDSDPPPKSAVRNTIIAAVAGHVVQAGTLTGDVHLHTTPQSTPVPRQLPAAPGSFVGRRHELTQLTATLDAAAGAGGTVVISAIAGAGGIGKTWLALYWAHQHFDRFPDGQIFVDLHGFAPTDEPMPPSTALRGFLDAFGIDPGRIPPDLDAQVALYRSLIANKQILIVLDNARDTDQVTTLLPGTSTCTVLVTSRDQLPGLTTAHGARRLALDVLDEDEARDLLTQRLGQERMTTEPEAIVELLARCAGLPLALSIVASRATAHPDFPLAVLAGELRDAAARLDALEEGDIATSLTAVLSWSYDVLSPEQAEVFGFLGLASGPDISLPAATNLTGLPVAQVGAVLRALEKVSLLQQHVPGRWQMHDLIRLYAADQAQHNQPDRSRDTGLRRLIDFYLHTAHAADRILNARRPPIEIGTPISGCHPHPPHDQTAAWTWFDAERPCLLAAQHLARDRGWQSKVWQLTWALDTFHYRRGYLHDRLTAWQNGLTAAQYVGDPSAIFIAHRLLGHACVRVGRHAEALEHLNRALDVAKDTNDLLGQAHTHNFLVKAWGQRGDDQRALEHATSAQHLFQALDHPVWEAQALNEMGWFAARLGHHPQARTHCEAALILCRRHQDHQGETHTLNSLGYLAHLTGDHDQALDYYEEALTLFRDLGHTYYEADTLDRLGQTHVALGHHDQAHHTWQQALRLYQDQHRFKDTDRVQQQLDDLTKLQGEVLDTES